MSAICAPKSPTANDCAEALMALIEEETGDMSGSLRQRLEAAVDALQTSAFVEGIDHERDRIVQSIRGLASGISLGLQ